MQVSSRLRPLCLAKILFDRTDEDHSLTTSQLLEILEKEYGIKTHRQTISSEVAMLKSFGLDIQEEMSSQKRYNLVSRTFDLAEVKMLIDAVESSKFITKSKSKALAAKLSILTGQNQAADLRRNISVEDRVKYDNENILLIIDSINEAINNQKKIKFLYFKYNVQKKHKLRNDGNPFIFSPYRLVWNGDFYYMIGVFDGGDVGTFRIDRILKRPEITDENAEPLPKDFDLNRYLQASFRMFGADRKTVELICTNDVVDAILDKFGKTVEIREQDGDRFKAEVEVAVSNVFYSWVFGFGGKVNINGPDEVRDKYIEMVKKALPEE